jgi:flagellar protein FliL
MPVEQRVVSRQKIGGGGGASAPAPAPAAEPVAEKKSRRGLMIVVAAVVVLLIGGAAAYFLLLKGDGAAAEPAPEPTPELGAVVKVDPISINLADGRYLRLGLGLQLTADAGEEIDASRALDLAIALYSGRPIAEVSDPATRDQLKAQLAEQLTEAYEGGVVDVYLTNYVTQ